MKKIAMTDMEKRHEILLAIKSEESDSDNRDYSHKSDEHLCYDFKSVVIKNCNLHLY